MPRIKLNPLLDQFQREVQSNLTLAADLLGFKEFRGDRHRPLRKRTTYLIAENAFLKLFISWEQFLEQTFIRYMRGGQTSSGYSPRHFVQPPSLEHALDFLKMARPYASWTSWSEVIRKARLCFDKGQPFTNASGGEFQLEQMRIIRNRIAHSSEHSEELFKRLVVLDRIGHNPIGMGPGRFLLSRFPNTNTKTMIQEYATLLDVMSRSIVP